MTVCYTKFGPSQCGASMGVCFETLKDPGGPETCWERAEHWFRFAPGQYAVGVCEAHRAALEAEGAEYLGHATGMSSLPLPEQGRPQ